MNNRFPIEQFIDLNNLNLEKLQSQHQPINIQKQVNEFDSVHLKKDDFNDLQEEILGIIKRYVTEQKFNAFFHNSFFLKNLSSESIIFAVTTPFIKKMIESHYQDLLNKAVSDILGHKYQITIQVLGAIEDVKLPISDFPKEEMLKDDGLDEKKAAKMNTFLLDELTPTQEDVQSNINSQAHKATTPDRFSKIFVDKNKTFGSFIIGPSNSIAHAFAVAVAKTPGKTHPSIYFHGNSGLGKTHLLHAICNHVADHFPHLRVCFTSGNAFFNEMVEAITNKSMMQFKRKYTEIIDVLIIDDIHELKNKNTTQNEFFHVFNEMQNKGKQLIFTSDKRPKEIDGIEERIKTRLSSALIVEIQQPDLETRIAILKQKAMERDIYLNEEVINLIASCIKSNIRELEGSLIKLGAYSDLLNVDIDVEIAKEQLKLSDIQNEKELSFDSISKAVSGYFKIQLGDLKGKSRLKEIAHARHVAMYMSKKQMDVTLVNIGEYYGKRDHTSVLHAITKIEAKVKIDKGLERQIYEIETLI